MLSIPEYFFEEYKAFGSLSTGSELWLHNHGVSQFARQFMDWDRYK